LKNTQKRKIIKLGSRQLDKLWNVFYNGPLTEANKFVYYDIEQSKATNFFDQDGYVTVEIDIEVEI